jgi:phosphatidylcholine synthase
VFVPIRYVYPSRTVTLRPVTLGLGAVWAALLLALIWRIAHPPAWLVWSSLIHPAYYVALSLWLTARR